VTDAPTATGRQSQPAAAFRSENDQLVAALSGAWQLEHASPRFEPLVEAALASSGAVQGGKIGAIKFDATALGPWDSSLLIFLREGQAYCESHDCAFDTAALPKQITDLLALAIAVPERVVEEEPPAPSRVARLGLAGIAAWDAARSAVSFLGELAQGLLRLLTGRTRMQWRAFWVVVQSNASGALPIVTLIALLVGVIIAFLGVVVLQRFGAGYYVSYLVGYGMLREMGALMTGIIIAGRTGAGFAAELGSMKITEELDAYATLGISAIDQLVLPRVLGLFVMMPLLVVYADAVGILGGLLVSVTLIDLTPTQFITGMLSAVSLSDALLGIFKATIYGAIVGFAGCMHGLRTGSDASAVGRSATSAVVLGITLIIVANAVVDWLAALWQI
jgi:phospholipid/cholesterol/gamma-HCH transport system permease protein